jgi:hypothetical protein
VQKQVRQIEPDIVAEDGQDDGEHSIFNLGEQLLSIDLDPYQFKRNFLRI